MCQHCDPRESRVTDDDRAQEDEYLRTSPGFVASLDDESTADDPNENEKEL